MSNIAIVLAVYNGSRFLAEQLDSLVAQSETAWDLYVRDDGSSDQSLNILAAYTVRDARFHLLSDGLGNLGVTNNFAILMTLNALASHSYIAFSDQDDVWLGHKLSSLMQMMRKMEDQYPGMPLLVYSDMSVVDVNLNLIFPSFMKYQGIKHEASDPLRVLLTQNFVAGCTIMVNRRLLDIALPIPEKVLMHDWWLALCAAVFGYIGYIDKPLVKYRQHGNNEVGAKPVQDVLNPVSGKWCQRWLEGRDNLFRSMKQAQCLAERMYERDPDNPNLPIVETYATLQYNTPMQRIKTIRQVGIHAQSRIRQMLLLSRLLISTPAK